MCVQRDLDSDVTIVTSVDTQESNLFKIWLISENGQYILDGTKTVNPHQVSSLQSESFC